MDFEFRDLNAKQLARLALEYVRETASWLEGAPGESVMGQEAAQVLSAAAESSRAFSRDLEIRIEERFKTTSMPDGGSQDRFRRRSELTSYRGADITPKDVLEAAVAEQMESYQFFLDRAADARDPWVSRMFEDIAQHSRSILLYLESERQSFLDADGS